MLKRLDYFIIRSYIGPFLITFSVSVFLLLMQFLWKYIDDLVGKGLDGSVIAELMLYASAGLVPMALPLATLLASIMTFGNMGEHNELMSCKSSGISLQRLMAPLIGVNLLIAIGAFYFSNNVLPYTNLRMGALLYDIRHQRPELNIKKGIFYKGIEGISIKIRDKEPERNMMYDIMIYDHRKRNGNLNVTIADSGSIVMSQNKDNLILKLFNGARYEDVVETRQQRRNKNHPLKREIFTEQQLLFELEGYNFNRTSTELFKHNYQMQNLWQLDKAIDSLEEALIDKKIRYYKRFFASNFKKELEIRKGELGESRNVDSLYLHSSAPKRLDAIEQAISLVRSAKTSAGNSIKEYSAREKWINKHKVEWHRKFTLSVACLLLFFIGAPFGAIVRKGGLGIPLLISIGFFLFYYIVSMTGEKSIKAGEVSSLQGMWTASALLLPIGVYLTFKATNDSTILNMSSYSAIFDKISSLFRKKTNIKDKFHATTTLSAFDVEKELEHLSSSIDRYLSYNYSGKGIGYIWHGLLFQYNSDQSLQMILNDYNSIYKKIVLEGMHTDSFIQEQIEMLPEITPEKLRKEEFKLFIITLILIPTFLSIIPGLRKFFNLKNKLFTIRSVSLTINSYLLRRGFTQEN